MIATQERTVTQEKAQELADSKIFEEFKGLTEISISDAIRLGSSNTEQAVGWGDGETMCAMHAAQSAFLARV